MPFRFGINRYLATFLGLVLIAGASSVVLTLTGEDNPAFDTVTNGNMALGRPVEVSSNAKDAGHLIDGEERANASWHTSISPPQHPARPSWISVDLERRRLIKRIVLTFSMAAYEGIYDIWSPPAGLVVQVGDGAETMRPVAILGSERVPNQGDCVDKRRLEVELEKAVSGRFIRVMFPAGGKLAAFPDVVGLGELAVYGPDGIRQPDRTAVLRGGFGEAEVNLERPQISRILLREPDGLLAARSLLAGPPRGLTLLESRDGRIYRRQGAYTYFSDQFGNRFESRRSRSHHVAVQARPDGEVYKIVFTGIRPQTETGGAGALEEDWTLESTPTGALSWTITQRWLRPVRVDISGTPALHLARFGGWGAHRDRRTYASDPQITSTVWYDPKLMLSGSHPDYETYAMQGTTEYRTHTLVKPDTWAIYKLFTNFHLGADVRLAAQGGYLFRRAGVRNDFNEIGSIVEREQGFERSAGQVSSVTLLISPVDKFDTGEQLDVAIPDPTLEGQLRDLHASVLNGGALSDPKRYDFGNGTEDVNYAGSAGMQAQALSVSTSKGMTSEHPYQADKAFKGHLERILGTVDARGLSRFGFNAVHDGELLDDNLHVISAVRTYAIKNGDLEFVKRNYRTLSRMADFFIQMLDKSTGLFRSPGKGAHWYYDGIAFSGFNTYYQAFLYRALLDLAELSEATGHRTAASVRKRQAARLAKAINDVLWYPDAPGGPRYADWIDDTGKRAAHFVDIAQYPLIALGIAPRNRAKAMLATADARLAELKKQYSHSRSASLSLLWPLSPTRGEHCFGTYFYGGSVLASTYWEVVARARAGHVDGEWGAYRLLQNFARRYAETSFVGSNSIDIRGNISLGGDEPYLADMVVVPAALVHGLLGVTMSWNKLDVVPALPAGWSEARTRVVWKGRSYNIVIQGGRATITAAGAATRSRAH